MSQRYVQILKKLIWQGISVSFLRLTQTTAEQKRVIPEEWSEQMKKGSSFKDLLVIYRHSCALYIGVFPFLTVYARLILFMCVYNSAKAVRNVKKTNADTCM